MKNIFKFLIGSILAVVIIITSIMTALSILKDEAVDNYLTISKLNAKAFSKELNQDLTNIEQVIENISTIFNLSQNKSTFSNQLKNIIKNYPQIRSINVLKDKEIIYSSYDDNLGLFITNLNLFPQSIFDENILKISTPWMGRDFIDGTDVYNIQNNEKLDEMSFIPISKKILSLDEEYEVIVNLNSDYFLNRFLGNINNSKTIVFELIRLDGILLLSTEKKSSLGNKISNMQLLDQTIEKSIHTGIEIIDGTKYLSTYILANNYPVNLAVKLDYEKHLLSWNKKQYNFFSITTLIIIVSIIVALTFFYLYNRKIEEQIKLKNLQIHDKEKFKLLFQDSHFLAAVIDNEGNILDLNNSALEFLDNSYSTLKESKFWELECWKKSDKQKIKRIVKDITINKIEDELVLLDRNKNERIIDFTFSSLNFENKNILVAIGLDITQKKEREKKLLLSYSIYSNTKDGIMITDKDTNLINVNKAFEIITGYKEREVLNKKANILKSNIHTNKFYENMWNCINRNKYWQGEITNLKKDGTVFTEHLTINVILDENEEIINYVGIFSDISEQKRKEKLLKQKDDLIYQQSKLAAMGEMIANIAHQWRQPLSVISTASTGILFKKDLGISTEEDERESLEIINKSSQYLSRTIDDFRNFLKIDKELKLFNLSKAVNDAVSLSGISNNKSDEITLDFNLDKVIDCYGIKNEFIQVMINIFNNAKDVLKNSKEIEKLILVDLYIKNEYIILEILDNGGGVDNVIIDRIFEPYFTTKHQSQGTGIGLYMSEEIIKNHMGGTLSVKNKEFKYRNKNYKGACFIISLPLK